MAFLVMVPMVVSLLAALAIPRLTQGKAKPAAHTQVQHKPQSPAAPVQAP